ncbi:MAG: 3'(2'),5'-bisphosphate nucleotidase CysQ [Candidatus Moraniibacteriota bacterium]
MNRTQFLKKIIQEAGEEILKYYKINTEIETKKDNSPLTQADLASNEILSENLAETGYPVLSEEIADDKKRLASDRVWIIDPLDGTMDFIQETGEFSVMVGLVENGKPVLGAVYQPVSEDLFYAEQNKGAFWENTQSESKPQKIQVSGVKDPKNARMVVSRNHLKPQDQEIAEKLQVMEYKKTGSNGVKICLIARGEADFFINSGSGMGEWDSCAPEIILREAGGIVTDITGERLLYNKDNPINKKGLVASNGSFHDRILSIASKQ